MEWQTIEGIDDYFYGPIRVGAYDADLVWRTAIARKKHGYWESSLPIEPTHYQTLPPPPKATP